MSKYLYIFDFIIYGWFFRIFNFLKLCFLICDRVLINFDRVYNLIFMYFVVLDVVYLLVYVFFFILKGYEYDFGINFILF